MPLPLEATLRQTPAHWSLGCPLHHHVHRLSVPVLVHRVRSPAALGICQGPCTDLSQTRGDHMVMKSHTGDVEKRRLLPEKPLLCNLSLPFHLALSPKTLL